MGRVGVPSLKEKGLSSLFPALERKPRATNAIICECGGRSKKPAVNFGSQKGKKPQQTRREAQSRQIQRWENNCLDFSYSIQNLHSYL